jgi:hypothetical protein
LLREIRIAAQPSNPQILTLIDSGETGGFLYHMMSYVARGSLRDERWTYPPPRHRSG